MRPRRAAHLQRYADEHREVIRWQHACSATCGRTFPSQHRLPRPRLRCGPRHLSSQSGPHAGYPGGPMEYFVEAEEALGPRIGSPTRARRSRRSTQNPQRLSTWWASAGPDRKAVVERSPALCLSRRRNAESQMTERRHSIRIGMLDALNNEDIDAALRTLQDSRLNSNDDIDTDPSLRDSCHGKVSIP